ncbi:hypothetical protein IFM89_039257 [Coptis chinensis]|uniref:Uncharacterized protein n=1 Tax=Coptis chinensis TaxID=261450 RepID=A0A835M8S6_9MAGN|nr:hypothetical protein IFM89_039257 [Coptis chinensis]
MIQSLPLLCAILTFFAFGGAYSIDFPFLRWKSNAILAAICIMGARAFSIQICVFLHIQRYVLGKPMAFTRSSVLATVFMCMFAVVVSVLKGVRWLGAAAVDMCHVALGIVEAYWEYRLKPWDMAARVLVAAASSVRVRKSGLPCHQALVLVASLHSC